MNDLDIKNISDNKYKVTLSVPLSDKWYDDVFFYLKAYDGELCYKLNHKENRDGRIYFESEIELPTKAIYHTFVSCMVDGKRKYLNKYNEFNDYIDEYDMRKLSVNFKVPDWAKGTMIYHIFVDRFNKSKDKVLEPMRDRTIHKDFNEDIVYGADPRNNNIWNADFYGGDLKGITEKLEYIKNLGFTILFLSPIVESQSNHRYDAANFNNVDPYCGTFEDLKELCDKAHELGMKVILDVAFDHTGNDSLYYDEFGNYGGKGAYNNIDSPYRKFYKFINNNFCYWFNFKNMPQTDSNSKEWQEYICGEGGVIDKLFECGIDGLRLDVADELSDEFIEMIREACERNKKDSFIYLEVWDDIMNGPFGKRGYVASGKSGHSTMNYQLMDGLVRYFLFKDVEKINYVLEMIKNTYPEDTIDSLMNSLSTHDISRIITILGCPELFHYYEKWGWDIDNSNLEFIKNFKMTPEQYELGKKRLLPYIANIGLMRGNLCCFYGDEIGMEGLGNLQTRRPMDWNKASEENDISSLISKLGKIKVNNDFLKNAQQETYSINRDYFAYERIGDSDKMFVAINDNDYPVYFDVPFEYYDGEMLLSINGSTPGILNPHGAVYVKTRK